MIADLSSAQVLTLERVRGVKVDDLQGLAAAGVDRAELARRAARVTLQMVFRDGFFHADPHPGNFFVGPGGRLGIIDFGMIGTVDEDTRLRLLRVLGAIATGDDDAMVEGLLGAVSSVIRQHHVVLPSSLALPFKTIVMSEGLGARLDPSFRLLDAVNSFADPS